MSGDQVDVVDLIRLSRIAQTDAPSRPVQAWLMLVCVVEVEVLLPPSFHDFLCPGLHQSPDKDNVMSWLTCRVLVGPRPRSSPHSISHARGRVSAFCRLAVHSTRFLTKHTHKHPHTRRSLLRLEKRKKRPPQAKRLLELLPLYIIRHHKL
jgi:hypothetical protein